MNDSRVKERRRARRRGLSELRASTEDVDLDLLLEIIREFDYDLDFYRDRRGRPWWRAVRSNCPSFSIPAGRSRLTRATANPILRLLEEVRDRDDEQR